jgi:hypothetical protein
MHKHSHSHSHSNKKTCIIGTGLSVAIASFLVFYNSAVDDDNPSENFNFEIGTELKIALMILSAAVGFNEFFEMIDHIGHNHSHAKLLPTDTSSDETYTPSYQSPTVDEYANASVAAKNKHLKKSGKIVITTAAAPLLLAAFYGLFTQGVSLMDAFKISDDFPKYFGAAVTTFILGARFVAIPVAHTIKNIWGGHAEFTRRVTGSREPVVFLSTWKTRLPVFLLFCGTHLAESLLLSNAVGPSWIFIPSVIGLTASRAIAHLDHASALPNAYVAWQQRSPCARTLTAFTGVISGGAHAASGILGTIYFWNKANTWEKMGMIASDLIEGFTGALEHQQHGGQHMATCL